MICATGVRSRCKDAMISSGEGGAVARHSKSRSAECRTLSWYRTSVAPPKRTNASGKSLKIVTAACSISVLTSACSRVNPLSSYFAICFAISTINPTAYVSIFRIKDIYVALKIYDVKYIPYNRHKSPFAGIRYAPAGSRDGGVYIPRHPELLPKQVDEMPITLSLGIYT